MLYGRFTGPRTKDPRCLATDGLTANEGTEYLAAGVTCRCAIGHGEKDFYPVTGTDIEDLRDAQGVPQGRQARCYLGFGYRKTSDLVDADVPIGKTHHANLVHGPRRPRPVRPCVTEQSRRWTRRTSGKSRAFCRGVS